MKRLNVYQCSLVLLSSRHITNMEKSRLPKFHNFCKGYWFHNSLDYEKEPSSLDIVKLVDGQIVVSFRSYLCNSEKVVFMSSLRQDLFDT